MKYGETRIEFIPLTGPSAKRTGVVMDKMRTYLGHPFAVDAYLVKEDDTCERFVVTPGNILKFL